MSRRIIVALVAVASLAALAPTAASAHWNGGWGHHAFFRGPTFVPQVRVFSPPVYSGYGARYDFCLRQRWIATPFGLRLRTVNVCAY